MSGYSITESEDELGPVLVLQGDWRPEYAEVFARHRVRGIRLSRGAGWKGDDPSFVSHLAPLDSLEIYSAAVHDVSVIEALPELKMIGLQCSPGRKIDFGQHTALEVGKLQWSPKLESILQCRSLHTLNIMNWPDIDLRRIELPGLRRLSLTSRKLESLGGVENLRALTSLDLHACSALETLDGIAACAGLEQLSVSSCKGVARLPAGLAALENLRTIAIDDCDRIESLMPLRGCRNLQRVSFVGSTRIEDGDLTVLEKLGAREVFFAPRRHYNRSRDGLSLQ